MVDSVDDMVDNAVDDQKGSFYARGPSVSIGPSGCRALIHGKLATLNSNTTLGSRGIFQYCAISLLVRS